MVSIGKCHHRIKEKLFKAYVRNISLLVVEGRHLIRGSRIVLLEKLNSRGLYSALISAIGHKPTSTKYFNEYFSNKVIFRLFIFPYLSREGVSANFFSKFLFIFILKLVNKNVML